MAKKSKQTLVAVYFDTSGIKRMGGYERGRHYMVTEEQATTLIARGFKRAVEPKLTEKEE